MKLRIAKTALTAASLFAFTSLASAQFSAVGSFVGNAQESFETQDTSNASFPACVADRTFGGQADLCTENGSGGAHITSGWGFGCTIQEYDGSRFFGSTGGAAIFTFDSGVTSFGGYFGTNNPGNADGVIEFFDAAGALLHSDTLLVPNTCTWAWHGWDTGGALVKSIRVVSNYSNGGFMMMDGLQAGVLGSNSATEYCFCDGTGNSTPAPCGNTGATGNGCANSANASGAHLSANGTASLAANSLVLSGTGMVAGQPGLYFQGNNAIGAGSGVAFGDGLRCTGGAVVRLQVMDADPSGNSTLTNDIVASQINTLAAGDTRRYQLWYRDPVNSPCGAGFNFSNAVEVVWQP